jgi:hypothetical protein
MPECKRSLESSRGQANRDQRGIDRRPSELSLTQRIKRDLLWLTLTVVDKGSKSALVTVAP